MQSELLDITIIGFLVLLFGATYRKRPSHVVRAWLFGWILILVHFAALLVQPSSRVAADTLTTISLAALFGCGLVFLSAPPRERRRGQRYLALILCLAGFGILACTVMAVRDISSHPAYFIAGAFVTAAWVMYGAGLPDISVTSRMLLLIAVSATT